MKALFLYILVIIPFSFLHAQRNSLDSSNKLNKKGVFYKTYQEFVEDSPSTHLDFTTKYYKAHGKDSIIIRATYQMADSLDNFDFWGFNDGQNTFITIPEGGKLKYWKAQCPGKNPYLYFTGPTGPLLMGLTDIALKAITPPKYSLYFINKEGKFQSANRYSLKQLLKDEPALYKEFKLDKFATDSSYIKYIIRYNEAKGRR